MKKERSFTLKEVEQLVKNAYDVGYADGLEGDYNECKDYINSNDFWNKNYQTWINEEITYVV